MPKCYNGSHSSRVIACYHSVFDKQEFRLDFLAGYLSLRIISSKIPQFSLSLAEFMELICHRLRNLLVVIFPIFAKRIVRYDLLPFLVG